MNQINLGADGERRVVAFRLLPSEQVVVIEAWLCPDGTWERMATPFEHIGEALKYIEATCG